MTTVYVCDRTDEIDSGTAGTIKQPRPLDGLPDSPQKELL